MYVILSLTVICSRGKHLGLAICVLGATEIPIIPNSLDEAAVLAELIRLPVHFGIAMLLVSIFPRVAPLVVVYHVLRPDIGADRARRACGRCGGLVGLIPGG